LTARDQRTCLYKDVQGGPNYTTPL